MSIRNVVCSLDLNQILTPVDFSGPDTVLVVVATNGDPSIGVTGTIFFAGAVQAFLTFDPTGLRVESYTLTNPAFSVQQSVENILRVL